MPWTDLPSPQMAHEAMRFYWRTRASVQPESWNLQFAVVVEDEVVGMCDLMAEHYSALRQFTTGSWLGREFQGKGLGKEFRMAALTLGWAMIRRDDITLHGVDRAREFLGVSATTR